MTGFVIENGRHVCGCPELGSLTPGDIVEVCDMVTCGRVDEFRLLMGQIVSRPLKRRAWWRRRAVAA